MVSKAVLLLLCFGLCTAAPANPKIVGGIETTIEDVPYQLELNGWVQVLIVRHCQGSSIPHGGGYLIPGTKTTQINQQWSERDQVSLGINYPTPPLQYYIAGYFKCGAALIGEADVVVAAYCVKGLSLVDLRILSGDTYRGQGTVHTVEVATVHPDYHVYLGIGVNDIAYLKVTPPFNLNNTSHRVIRLADKEPSAGDVGLVSGWGVTSENSTELSSALRKVELPIISRKDCQEFYGADLVDNSMICAGLEEGGKAACDGDDGGPLVINGTLVGLVSWANGGCAQAGVPEVYTNVYAFKSWIEEQVAANK